MMAVLLDGLAFGILLALMVGPVFFALIQTSIARGFRAGIWMAVGIALTDIAYIVLSFWGVTGLLGSLSNGMLRVSLGMIGGFVLFGFGLSTIFRKGKKPSLDTARLRKRDSLKLLLQGMMLNALNPFTFLFWIGVVTLVVVRPGYHQTNLMLFFAAVVFTDFVLNMAKANLAIRLGRFINDNLLTWLNRLVGAALSIFGLRMLWYAFTEFVK